VLLLPTATSTPPPPLTGTTTTTVGQSPPESRFPGRLRSDERVEVGLAGDGSPARVLVTQRLLISSLGDFSFTVPAPATAVVAAPGSQAQPGLRDLGIVWQGFSSGRRLLASTATLRPEAAAQALPLRVSVAREGERTTVRFANVATRRILLATGSASPAAVRDFVSRFRAAQRRAGDAIAASGLFAVSGTPAGQAPARVVAPLRVRGTITVPGRAPVAVSEVLGGGRPLTWAVSLPGSARPAIALRVDLLDPLELMPTPEQAAAARDPLSSLQRALGSIALSWQYRHFVSAPDQLGPSTATYAYRTLMGAPAAAEPSRDDDGAPDTLVIVIVSVLGAAALAGALALWAHL
jgi:hypothetical protein